MITERHLDDAFLPRALEKALLCYLLPHDKLAPYDRVRHVPKKEEYPF